MIESKREDEILTWHETEDLLVWHKTFETYDEDFFDDFDMEYTTREIIQLLGINPDDNRIQVSRVHAYDGLKLHIRCNVTLLAWFITEFEVRGTLLRYQLKREGETITTHRMEDLLCDTTHDNSPHGKERSTYFGSAPTQFVSNTHSYREEIVKSLVEPSEGMLNKFLEGLRVTQGKNLYTLKVGDIYTMYCQCSQHMMSKPLPKEVFVEELKQHYNLELDLMLGDYRLSDKPVIQEIMHVEEMITDDFDF